MKAMTGQRASLSQGRLHAVAEMRTITDSDRDRPRVAGPRGGVRSRRQECLSGLIWQKRRQRHLNRSFRANRKISSLAETNTEEKLLIWNNIFPLRKTKSCKGHREKSCRQDNSESKSSEPSPLSHQKDWL